MIDKAKNQELRDIISNVMRETLAGNYSYAKIEVTLLAVVLAYTDLPFDVCSRIAELTNVGVEQVDKRKTQEFAETLKEIGKLLDSNTETVDGPSTKT
jgi:hypothetical protein